MTGVQTCAVFWLKGEHLQRTVSFKMRGAMNKVLCLTEEERKKGIITASSGNHGMATTQAARVGGLEVTIYLPESVSPLKLSNMKRLGANTVLVPGNGVEAENIGRAAAEREGKTLDRKSTRLNSSHKPISYAVFCLKKK